MALTEPSAGGHLRVHRSQSGPRHFVYVVQEAPMPIAAINPFNGTTIEVFQPLTAGQLDWKLGTEVDPLATAEAV